MKTTRVIGIKGGRRKAALIFTAAAIVCGACSSASGNGCFIADPTVGEVCAPGPVRWNNGTNCSVTTWSPVNNDYVRAAKYGECGGTAFSYGSVYATKTIKGGFWNSVIEDCVTEGEPGVTTDHNYICTTAAPATASEECPGEG